MKKALSLLLAAAAAFTAQAQPAAAPGASGAATGSAAPTAAAAAPTGSAEAGHRLVSMCMGCHNIIDYKATFPELHRVPKIAGQSATYIVAALNEYKKGDRKHPTMHGIAVSLSDQDIHDVAAYYEALGKQADEQTPVPDTFAVAPSPEVEALLKKGNCVSCHGANLNKPLDPSYPKLSGQLPDYLYVALKSYQTDENPRIGRNNPIMGAQAKQFTHDELKALADFIGSQPSDLHTVPESRFR